MSAALFVIDMLNPYDHEDAEPLVESVAEALEPAFASSRREPTFMIGPCPIASTSPTPTRPTS